MSKRGWFVSLVVVLCLLGVAWLVRHRGASSSAASERVAEPHTSASIDRAAERPLALDDTSAPSRESVAVESAPSTASMAALPLPAPDDASDATLIARVVDVADASPIPNMRVNARIDGQPTPYRPVDRSTGTLGDAPLTDENGVATLEVPSATSLWLSVADEQHRTSALSILVPALVRGERREVVASMLRPTAEVRVHGRVVDERDRSPVSDALVRIVRAEWIVPAAGAAPPRTTWQEEALGETRSNSDGGFELVLQSRTPSHLRAEKRGFAPGYGLVDLGAVAPEAVTVALRPAATLRGRVVDATHAPLEGATVTLACDGVYALGASDLSKSTWTLPDLTWLATTDSDGRCEWSDLAAQAPLSVEIRVVGAVRVHHPDSLTLVAGEVRNVTWRIGGGCALRGTMLDQRDAPVQGHLVWLKRDDGYQAGRFDAGDGDSIAARATTDGDGRFSFDDVAEGSWLIGPAPSARRSNLNRDELPAATTTLVTIPVGTHEQEIVLHVWRGLSVRGRVIDARGRPVERASVRGTIRGRMPEFATSGANGEFMLGPLGPDTIEVNAHGRELLGQSRPVLARPGGDPIVLELPDAGVVLGTVVDARTGEPCAAQAWIRAQHAGEDEMPTYAAEGIGFRFDAVEPGVYDVVARTQDDLVGVLRDVVVIAGRETEGLVVRAAKGATLRILYTGDDDFPIVTITSGTAVLADQNIARGEPASFSMPPGPIKIVLSVRGETAQEAQVDLVAGETKEIRLSQKE